MISLSWASSGKDKVDGMHRSRDAGRVRAPRKVTESWLMASQSKR